MRTDPSVSRRLLRAGIAGIIGSALALAGAGRAHAAAAFTPGNIVVYRVGTGTGALTSASTAVFLDEYTPAGVLVQSVALPTAANGTNNPLTASGTATSEGFISRSVDGNSIVLSGYAVAPGTATVNTTATTAVPRVIGFAGTDGTVDTSTTTTAFSAVSIRSVASLNSGSYYAAGANTGVVYNTKGSSGTPTIVSTTVTNNRQVAIYPGAGANSASTSQLYFSTGSGTHGVYQVGTGTPTSTGQTSTSLVAASATASPYSFVFLDLSPSVPGADTLYIADDAGTIQKYSVSTDGTTNTFTANGTVAVASVRGLTASVSGTSVTLYATTAATTSTLVSLTDTSGYGATITGTPTTLVTLASTSNMAFRGVAFAPGATSTVATTGAIISEFRERGSANPEDEYVEIANTTNAALDISGWKLTYTGGGTPQTVTIPTNTSLPALGHYLIVGTGYSLANYGGTGAAAGNQTLTTGIDDSSTLTLLNATSSAQDTVTFGTGGLTAPTAAGQYAFVRQPNLTTGLPVTTANAFNFVSLNAGTYGTAASALGAPGPENLSSPTALQALRVTLLDPQAAQGVAPNRVRNTAATGTNATNGTLAIRRLVTNNTGAAITRLRFRIVNLSTLNSSGYSNAAQADLRSIASPNATQNVTITGGNAVQVFGTTPDTTITQTSGGGINSSSLESSSGVVTLSTPIAAGATRAYDFSFGVVRGGNFTILILFESANGTGGGTANARKTVNPIISTPIMAPVAIPAPVRK